MTDPILRPRRENRWLEEAREGMRVYDNRGQEVGKVAQVFFGSTGTDVDEGPGGPANTPSPLDTPGDDIFNTGLGNQTGTANEPETLRNRLNKQGFLRIGGGLLSSDRFALPSQIESVSGDEVKLNVSQDQLIKR
jgi:hypothetical protein